MKKYENTLPMAEFIRLLANRTSNDIQDVQYVMDEFKNIVSEELLKGKKIYFHNLFAIQIVNCKAKDGLNNYGIQVHRKGFKKIKLTAGYAMKKMLLDAMEKENGSENISNGEKEKTE